MAFAAITPLLQLFDYILLRFQRQCNNNYYQIADAKLGMSLHNNHNYYDDQVTEKNLITGLKNVKQDKNWSGTRNRVLAREIE